MMLSFAVIAECGHFYEGHTAQVGQLIASWLREKVGIEQPPDRRHLPGQASVCTLGWAYLIQSPIIPRRTPEG